MDTQSRKDGLTQMNTRAESLAARVEQANNDLLAAVEASTPEQWAAPCSDGEWTQGFAAYHAAAGIGLIAERVKAVAGGEPFPMVNMAEIDAENAAQAKEHGDCTQTETIDLIRKSAPEASSIVRSLTDDQLDLKVKLMETMPEVTLENLVQMGLTGHPAYHLGTIAGAR